MAVGSFAAANFAIFGGFPSFIVKNGEEEMLQIRPISLFYVFGENDPKRAWDCSPKHLLKKGHWDCSPRPFSWFTWVSKLICFAYLAPKKALNRRNVKHIKLVLSKEGKILRRQTSPQAYTYIYIYTYIHTVATGSWPQKGFSIP